MSDRILSSLMLMMLSLVGCSGGVMSEGNDPGVHFDDPKTVNLCTAVMAGDIDAIDKLVSDGVDVNFRGKDGMTPLLFSMGGFNKLGLERLMELGADPNLQTENKDSYMRYAARANDIDYLKMGLSHGGDPNLRGKMGRTLLFEAAMENNESVEESLDLLLKNGADINAVSKGVLENAAMAAARINQYIPALFLLQKGIDYHHENKAGYSIARPLEANGIGYNPGYEGYDARTKVAKFLTDHGVEVRLKKPYESPPDWIEKSFDAIGEPVPDNVKEQR